MDLDSQNRPPPPDILIYCRYDRESGKCIREPPQGGLQYLSEQLQTSLSALGHEAIDLYYLHWPDHCTPLKDTLSTLKGLHDDGRFTRWGLSNFEAQDVVRICTMCKEMNILAPSVYQGMYNPLTRKVEEELLPVLRNLGISFYAYNPLAGGLLTGKHELTNKLSSGRFNSDTAWGKKYQDRYWDASYFEAVEQLKAVCSSYSLSLTEASLRWLRLHSALNGEAGDAIILGGSSMAQIEQNVCAAEVEAELPIVVQAAFQDAWAITKGSCPPYFK